MTKIKEEYDDNKFKICRALIYGKPGKGKSFIGKLLAKELGSKLAFDLRIEEPGNPLLTLWKIASSDANHPLIVQIDEFDIFINKIHNETMKHDHIWYRSMVYDKQSY